MHHSLCREVLIAAIALAGCSKQASISTTPTPAPAPAPTIEAVPAAAEEPEAAPIVKEEPKSLDIQKDVIRLKPGIKILFAADSDKLLDASFPILDEVASVFEQNQRLRIRVEGHTDSDGKADHNQDLSTRRAASVRTYLISKGVGEDRLESAGCGQAVPVADNKTDDGKQQNRRVEFVILRKRRQVEPCQVYHPREHHKRDQQDAAQPTPATP